MNSSEPAGAQWKWTTKPKKHVSHTKLVRFCSPTHVIAQEDQIETVQTLLLNSDPKWAQSRYSCYKLSSNPSHLSHSKGKENNSGPPGRPSILAGQLHGSQPWWVKDNIESWFQLLSCIAKIFFELLLFFYTVMFCLWRGMASFDGLWCWLGNMCCQRLICLSYHPELCPLSFLMLSRLLRSRLLSLAEWMESMNECKWLLVSGLAERSTSELQYWSSTLPSATRASGHTSTAEIFYRLMAFSFQHMYSDKGCAAIESES